MRLFSLLLVALLVLPAGVQAQFDDPFGPTSEMLDADGKTIAEKWRTSLQHLKHAQKMAEACRRVPQVCAPVVRDFNLAVDTLTQMENVERIKLMHNAARRKVRYVPDYIQWNVADRWSPAFETVHTGKGDCEDFAIIWYTLSRQIGIPPSKLRLLVLRVRPPWPRHSYVIRHAVFAEKVGDDWYVADSSISGVLKNNLARRTYPLYVFDETGGRSYVAPTSQVAEAR